MTTFKADGATITVYLDVPDWDDQPTAALGAFRSRSAEGGRAVMTQAVEFARAQGVKRLIGPMDGDTWHSYRFVTDSDGSPAFLMEPTNQPHEAQTFTDAGFQQIAGYFSARVPLSQTADAVPTPTDAFTIETWDGENPQALFEQVFELSTTAFAQNAFYKPISRDDFLAMYMPVVPMIRRELIFFARAPDGTLLGFLFGIPNYAEGPTPQSAILKTYASLQRGVGRHLAHAFHSAALQAGYTTAIHALIHDDNLSALRSAAEGAQVFRRYGLFGLILE